MYAHEALTVYLAAWETLYRNRVIRNEMRAIILRVFKLLDAIRGGSVGASARIAR